MKIWKYSRIAIKAISEKCTVLEAAVSLGYRVTEKDVYTIEVGISKFFFASKEK